MHGVASFLVSQELGEIIVPVALSWKAPLEQPNTGNQQACYLDDSPV
jgi:hypothetical protein